MKVVGQGLNRVDAYGKVTGEAKYSADLEPRDILHGKVIHSTIANGLVKSFDLTEALKVPGVVKILTCFDAPDCQFPTAGHPWSVEAKHQDICDRRVLNQRVRLYGDDIAAVVAENEVAAAQAARLVKVEYEEYEPIVTVKAAMAPGATPLHPDIRKDNVIVHSHMTMGPKDFTFEDGLKQAKEKYKEEDLVEINEVYDTPRISHCHIELPVSWAYVDVNGKVTVVSSTQIPHIVRRCTAQALGIPIGKVRIIKPYIGGGFGNKQDVLYEPLNAFLTMSVGGRPVRLEISREETISGTRTRHAIEGVCRGLVTKDGTVLARQLDAYANNGGYASHGHAICANCGNVFKDLYRDRLGAEIDCWTVYTSSPTAGAMRGYGIPQAAWFAECLTDDMATAIGMDPYEFRMKNCMEDGFVDPANGITFHTYGLKKCMEAGKKYIHWDEKRKEYANQTGPVRRGVGMSIFCYKTGVHPISLETSSVRMVLNQDGSMQVSMGATEIGQGADTAYAQMCAEILGLSDYKKVHVLSCQDTDVTPTGLGAYASRQTFTAGFSIRQTSELLKRKILEYACEVTRQATYNMDIIDSNIVRITDGRVLMSLSELSMTAQYNPVHSEHLTAESTYTIRNNAYSFGCTFAEVEVDIPMCKVKLLNIVNVHDCGKLINPALAEAQVHGGMSMGIGYGLSEQLLFDEKTGRPLNNNLLDYKLSTFMDHPNLEAEFVENYEPTSAFGTKALGEPPACSPAPAIRNAIYHATGVAINQAPITPHVLFAKFTEAGLIQD